jgi:O-antigen/teichoic acid export membrane protein
LTSVAIRDSSLLLVGRVLAMAINMGTQVLIVRGLSKVDYGTFAYGLSIVTLGRVLVGLGHNHVIAQSIARYEERRDYDRLFGLLVMVVAMIGVTTAAMYLVIWLGWEPIEQLILDAPGAMEVLVVILLLAPIQVIDDAAEGLLAALSDPRSIFVRKYIVAPGLRLLAVLVLVAIGANVQGVALGYVTAAAAGTVLYCVVVLRALAARGLLAHFDWRRLRFPARSYFGVSLPLLSAELFHVSQTTGSALILGGRGNAVAVADYRSVRPAAVLNQFAFTSFIVLFRPLAARLHERGDHAGLREAYWGTAAWLVLVTFPVLAMTVPFATQTTVFLFGEEYRSAAPLLAIMSTGYFLNVALGFNGLMLQTLGRIRYVATFNVAASVLNILLCLWLIPTAGAGGAAVANAVALIALNLAVQAALTRHSGVGMLPRGQAYAFASLLVAVGSLLAVQAVWDPPFALAVLAATGATAILFAVHRDTLRLTDTFPVLRQLPLLGRFM